MWMAQMNVMTVILYQYLILQERKKMITCICRAHRDGCIPDNCSNDRIFAYGWGIANNVVDVKRGAEKMVKDLLGAKSTHHIQCRCTDGKGGKVISH